MPRKAFGSSSSTTLTSSNTSGFDDYLSLTFTPDANSTYILFFSSIIKSATTTSSARLRVIDGAATTLVEGRVRSQNATSDRVPFDGITQLSYGASPSSQTVKLQFGSTSGAASIYQGKLIALKLESGDFSAYTAAETSASLANAVTATALSQAFTIPTTGDYIVLATTVWKWGDSAFKHWVDPATGVRNGRRDNSVYDANDYDIYCTAFRHSFTAGSRTVQIQAEATGSSTYARRQMCLALLRVSDLDQVANIIDVGPKSTTSTTLSLATTLSWTATASKYLLIGNTSLRGQSTSASVEGDFRLDGTSLYTTRPIHVPNTDRTERGKHMLFADIQQVAAGSRALTLYYRTTSSGTGMSVGETNLIAIGTIDDQVASAPHNASVASIAPKPTTTATAVQPPSGQTITAAVTSPKPVSSIQVQNLSSPPNRLSPGSWSLIGTVTVDQSTGDISLAATGTTVSARQGVTTVPGRKYRLSWSINGFCAFNLIGTTSGGSEIRPIGTCDGAGDYAYEFVAPTTSAWIRFQRSTSGTANVTNLLLHEMGTVTGNATAPKPTVESSATTSALPTSPFTDEFSWEFGGEIAGAGVASVGAVSPKPTASSTATQVFPARNLTASALSPKPTTAATTTQTFPARTLTAAAVSPKPTTTATSTQTFPARNLTGSATAPKPTTASSASVTRQVSANALAPRPVTASTAVQVFPARTVTASAVSPKPSTAAESTQTFPARTILADALSPKPTSAASVAQTFPARTLTANAVAPKPTTTANATTTRIASVNAESPKPLTSSAAVQLAIGAAIASVEAIGPAPTAAAIATQTFPARTLTGNAVAPKPTLAATATQTFPAATVTAAATAPKPVSAALANTSTIAPHTVTAAAVSPKPTTSAIADSDEIAAQTATIAAVSPKPTSAAVAQQSAIGSVASSVDAMSPKPTAAASVEQVFPARFASAHTVSPKPSSSAIAAQVFVPANATVTATLPRPLVTATVQQLTIGASLVNVSATAPKPVAAVAANQEFPARSLIAQLSAPKPTVRIAANQGGIAAIIATSSLVAPKPTTSSVAGQTFPARNFATNAIVSRPTSSVAVAQTFPEGTAAAAAFAPKPVVRIKVSDLPEYAIPAGLMLANQSQLALASGYILLLASDPEGVYELVHPIAPPFRTVEAGFGADALVFQGPIDPSELKYFTVTWNTELGGTNDTIVPDTGIPEGQSVFLELAGPATASGVLIHAQSHDTTSVTFWLKIDPSMKNRPEWSGQGELHMITVRVITTRGQIFERQIGFRVRQL